MAPSKPVAAKTDQQQRLRDTLDDLKSRAAELALEQEKLSVAIASLEVLLEPPVTGKTAPANQRYVEVVKNIAAVEGFEPPSLKGKGQKEAAIQVLCMLGSARLPQIMEGMKNAGFQFKAKKPYQSLYKALSNTPEVVKVGKSWKLVGARIPKKEPVGA